MIDKNLITEALHYIGNKHPEYKAVQIGAMDGINFDNTRGFFDMYTYSFICEDIMQKV